jgi:hypothetical protein
MRLVNARAAGVPKAFRYGRNLPWRRGDTEKAVKLAILRVHG